jgi:glucosamine--fructose-6-phosphate aminotransferase (isomerizing)
MPLDRSSSRRPRTPLLGADSPLDAGARSVVAGLYRNEGRRTHAVSSDDPLDPERRRRVELTLLEMLGQPDANQETLDREEAATRQFSQSIAASVRAPKALASSTASTVRIVTRLELSAIRSVS